MQVILQFCLIAILLEEAFSSGVCYNNHACVKMTINSLKIPDDNPKIKGEKDDAGDSWYTWVNWLDKPVGNLTLVSYTQYYDGPKLNTQNIRYINLYEKSKHEYFEWTKWARKALGLHSPLAKIPGKVRVSRKLFSGDECTKINFENPWPNSPNYYVYLKVYDDNKDDFLIGYIKMNK